METPLLAMKIVERLKRFQQNSATILLGPLLSTVADAKYEETLKHGVIKYSITDIIYDGFIQHVELPIFTVTFGAADDTCNVPKCSLKSGGGLLFRRMCYTEDKRFRTLQDLILRQNWAEHLVLVKGPNLSGEEPVTESLVNRIDRNAFPQLRSVQSDIPSLCGLDKKEKNVFIVGLEDQEVKKLFVRLSSSSRCDFIFDIKNQNVIVLLSSSGINYLQMLERKPYFSVAIGRHEPNFLAVAQKSHIDLSRRDLPFSNVTTNEILIGAYESVLYSSHVAKALIENSVSFKNIRSGARSQRFQSTVGSVGTPLNSRHKLNFNADNGNRLARFDLVIPGPETIGSWTADGGLQCKRCPNSFKSDSMSSMVASESIFLVLLIIVCASFFCLLLFAFRYRKLQKLFFHQADAWAIAPDEVHLSKMIGKGAYGSVWKGTYNSTIVAIKTFDGVDKVNKDNFVAEFVKLIDLRHKHLIQFVGAVLETRAIVTDFMERGDLRHVLFDESRRISASEKIEWVNHISLGLEYLHSKGVVHCDIKTANILVDKNYICKIADFGLTSFRNKKKMGRASDSFKMKNKNLESFRSNGYMNDFNSGPKGTPLWLPPEVVRGQEYTLEGDVFAFGLLLAEIINRKQNFATERSSMNQYKITALITKDNLRPEWVKDVPGTAQLDFVRDIARKCWTDDKSKDLVLNKYAQVYGLC